MKSSGLILIRVVYFDKSGGLKFERVVVFGAPPRNSTHIAEFTQIEKTPPATFVPKIK